jgi:hypothetical protein
MFCIGAPFEDEVTALSHARQSQRDIYVTYGELLRFRYTDLKVLSAVRKQTVVNGWHYNAKSARFEVFLIAGLT